MGKLIFISLFCLLLFSASINSQESLADLKEQVESVCQEPEVKNFSKTTLAYITPWNSNGIDLVLKYLPKFDIISPCWFEIKPEILQGKFQSKIEGSNNVNMNFIQEIREQRKEIKVLPRFKCEGFNANQYESWVKEDAADQFIRILIRRLK